MRAGRWIALAVAVMAGCRQGDRSRTESADPPPQPSAVQPAGSDRLWGPGTEPVGRSGRWYRGRLRFGEYGVPFHFQMTEPDAEGRGQLVLVNGPEVTAWDYEERDGSRHVDVSRFYTHMTLEPAKKGAWRGTWAMSIPYRGHELELVAEPMVPSEGTRFEAPEGSANEPADFSGAWVFDFDRFGRAIARLRQRGGRVWGNVDMARGSDLRHVEGNAFGNRLFLSAFDGQHAFAFEVEYDPELELVSGVLHVAPDWREAFTGERSEPEVFSKEVEFEERPVFDRTFLTDHDLVGRPFVVELMGSWCSNCMDAAPRMKALHAEFSPKGVAFVGLSLEMVEDPKVAAGRVRSFVERYAISYPVVPITGSQDTLNSGLPVDLPDFAIPSFLFVNREGAVVHMRNGYSGPATGKAHQQQNAEFERLLEALAASSKGTKP